MENSSGRWIAYLQFSWPSVANLAKDLVAPSPFILIPLHAGWHGRPHIINHMVEINPAKQHRYFWRVNLGPFCWLDLPSGPTQLRQHGPGSEAWKGVKAWSGGLQICVCCYRSHVFWPTVSSQKESNSSTVMAVHDQRHDQLLTRGMREEEEFKENRSLWKHESEGWEI